jgi:hypothetical protein
MISHTDPSTVFEDRSMSRDNIIPFRKRPPSDKEMDVYRVTTRRWSDASKQLLLPEHFSMELAEREKDESV